MWQYSRRRFTHDNATLTTQENKARAVVDGQKSARRPRFVKGSANQLSLDEACPKRARAAAGLKGYVTNMTSKRMSALEVIASYRQLWHVEDSWRMSKHDLKARPIFHHTRESIKAHLTMVMTALALARYLQDTTGMSIKKVIRTPRPLREDTININDHDLIAQPQLTDQANDIITALSIDPAH